MIQTCFYHRKYIGIDTIFGMVEIFEVTQPNDSFLAALNDLLPQLSTSAQPMSMNSLVELVQSNAVHLYLAAVDGEIVGSLTLVVFPIPTGVRAWIEDVVVDVRGRGKGVGKALTHHALLEAKKYSGISEWLRDLINSNRIILLTLKFFATCVKTKKYLGNSKF